MSGECWQGGQMNGTFLPGACAEATIHNPLWLLCVLGVVLAVVLAVWLSNRNLERA